jgi:hypothetical protein
MLPCIPYGSLRFIQKLDIVISPLSILLHTMIAPIKHTAVDTTATAMSEGVVAMAPNGGANRRLFTTPSRLWR